MSASVLPTHVGMSRLWSLQILATRCAPHTRGDEPGVQVIDHQRKECSPHTWG